VTVAACVLLLLGCALLARSCRGRTAVVAAVCVCAAASGLVTGLHSGSRTSGPLAALAADEAAVTVVAVLTEDPRRALSAAAARPGRELVVVRLRVEQLEARGRVHRLRAPVVLLSAEAAWLPLLPSQRVRVEGRLRPAERGDDVTAVLSGRGEPEVLSGPRAIQRAAGYLRAGLREAVAPLPEAEQGLLPGLVVGDVSRLDPQLREDFRTTGLTHLTAVSGVNAHRTLL
jgi:competence protein ComEC